MSLNGHFKLWAQARSQRAIHRPEIEQRNCNTTRLPHSTTSTTAATTPSTRPSKPGLGPLASPFVASFPCPGPLAPYLTSAEMNTGPSAIIHARAAGLFHPNQTSPYPAAVPAALSCTSGQFDCLAGPQPNLADLSEEHDPRVGSPQLQPRFGSSCCRGPSLTKFPQSGKPPTPACLGLPQCFCTCISATTNME